MPGQHRKPCHRQPCPVLEPCTGLVIGRAMGSGATTGQKMDSLGLEEMMEMGPQEHKKAQLFHVLFRGAALLVYLLANLFSLGFATVFVVCVLLLASDFWTVKNITGRILVGLRWWNEVKDDGDNVWIFESKPASREVHPTDSYIFWTALYVTPAIWVLFAIGAIFSFKFEWLLIILVGLLLSTANLVGYWKCQRDAKSQIQSFIAQRLY